MRNRFEGDTGCRIPSSSSSEGLGGRCIRRGERGVVLVGVVARTGRCLLVTGMSLLGDAPDGNRRRGGMPFGVKLARSRFEGVVTSTASRIIRGVPNEVRGPILLSGVAWRGPFLVGVKSSSSSLSELSAAAKASIVTREEVARTGSTTGSGDILSSIMGKGATFGARPLRLSGLGSGSPVSLASSAGFLDGATLEVAAFAPRPLPRPRPRGAGTGCGVASSSDSSTATARMRRRVAGSSRSSGASVVPSCGIADVARVLRLLGARCDFSCVSGTGSGAGVALVARVRRATGGSRAASSPSFTAPRGGVTAVLLGLRPLAPERGFSS